MIMKKYLGLRLSALSLGCLMALPGIAMADEAREQALEQRINDLEAQLQQLASEIRAQRTAPAAAPAALPAGKLPIQLTTLTPGSPSGTTLKVGGFVKADFMVTKAHDGMLADGATGRALYIPGQTPVGGNSSDAVYDAHAKFSRFNVGIDTVTEGGDKAGAFLEMDFFGNALGTQTSTNTYGVTVRHAYAYWNHWLAGQTWSNFQDVASMPEGVDFIGATDGTVFVRQPQVRYTNGAWTLSMENPETTITPFHGGTRISSDDNNMPDLIGRYTHKAAWGHLTGALMLRQLAYETTGTNAIDDSSYEVAGSFSGRYNFNPNNDLRFALNVGSGLGRYIGLGIASDAMLDGNGNIEGLDGVAGFIGFHHNFSAQVRGNIYYSASKYDNDAALTGGAVTESVSSISANLFYSPLPKLDVGAELRFADRELESGVDGSLTRLHFLARYSF